MSTAESLTTATDSRAGTMQPESTVPSSPMTDPTEQETKLPAEGEANGVEGHDDSANVIDDTEDMDNNANALMHLLKTSSVSPFCFYDRNFVAELTSVLCL